MKGLVVLAAALSLGNVSPAIVPPSFAAAQQVVTLGAWLAFIALSYGVPPATRLGAGTEAIALLAFYGLACTSVLWANQSVSSVMKATALCITSFATWRMAATLSVDTIVGCTAGAFMAVCCASLAIVILAPDIGIDRSWMHDGDWQGVFESKQSLGGVAALLIVMAFHRWRAGRSGTRQFIAILALAGTLNVMSGSRDAGGLAVLGCLALAGAERSLVLARALCLAPAAMALAAAALFGGLWVTGEPFIPLFGTKVDLTERVVIWAYALSRFGDRPIAGFGLDGFWSNPEVLQAFDRQHGWVLDNYHDGYLAVLMETGLVGLALLVAAAVLYGLKAAWLSRPGRMDPADHRLMVVVVALIFFANFTETVFLRSTNYVAVLGLVFMAVACRRADGTPPSSGRPPRPGGGSRPGRPAVRGAAGVAFMVAIAGPCAAAAAEEPAFATARSLGRGINILGSDGIWDGHRDNPFRLSSLRAIRAAGFGHVRINMPGFRHMGPDGRLDETFLEALDTVVEAAVAAGLVPVVDEHDNVACQADPDGCSVKLKRFWTQVAARYAGRVPTLVFELLNEPGWRMTEDGWNRLAAETLAIVRATNPRRTVVLTLLNSLDPHDIERLPLPEFDRGLIVTVHDYKPLAFTHQGAPWSREFAGTGGIGWGTPADRAAAAADLDVYAAWGAAHRRPIYLGEFGVYEAAPPAARVAYDEFMARAAERRGWPWAYWQFDHDFAAFDMAGQRWNRPILDALVPPSAAIR